MSLTECINCGSRPRLLFGNMADFEYGVAWQSSLMECPACGLVSQDPPIQAGQIPALYPSDYLALGSSSKAAGIYGKLKAVLADRTIKRFSSLVVDGGTFLEVGCGNGHLIERLAERRGDVNFIGVDIEEAHGLRLDRFTFFKGQLEEVEIPEKSVDVLYCSNLIEHVADPVLFLNKCMKVLKPGGLLYGVTPNHNSVDRKIFGRRWGGYHYPRHTYIFNDKNLKELLLRCGFAGVKMVGGYSFWYISLANLLMPGHGRKKRGILFALVSAAALPLDIFINLFRCHGSMTFTAKAPR